MLTFPFKTMAWYEPLFTPIFTAVFENAITFLLYNIKPSTYRKQAFTWTYFKTFAMHKLKFSSTPRFLDRSWHYSCRSEVHWLHPNPYLVSDLQMNAPFLYCIRNHLVHRLINMLFLRLQFSYFILHPVHLSQCSLYWKLMPLLHLLKTLVFDF